VRDFFRIYYAPNNAVVALVGDLDTQKALAVVNQYFGAIASQPAADPPDLSEPEHYAERRETITDKLAREPMVLIAYHIPAGNTPDNDAVRVLESVLGTGRSSRLYQHLVKEKQLATEINTETESRMGPSMIYLWGTPRPGVKPEDLERAIYDEIEMIKREGVTAAELEKVRTFARRDEIQARESSLSTARRLAEYAVYFDDPSLINTTYEKLSAVTAGQIKAVASKYLVPTGRSVVITLPPTKAQPQTQ
jgi:zinc protease